MAARPAPRRLLPMALLALLLAVPASAQEVPRARDLGIPFDGAPGPRNAITDVAGVEVGHATLISGEGPRVPGVGKGEDPSGDIFVAFSTADDVRVSELPMERVREILRAHGRLVDAP
ncbi:hypothetical protein BH20GEM1_BH20GEM1_22920 [soil metagenome]